MVLAARDLRPRRRHDLGDRRRLEVEPLPGALAIQQHAIELVTRDREQVSAEARFFAELIARAQAREERRLHELVGLGFALGLEESVDAVEVALEQSLTGAGVPASPLLE